MGKARKKSVRKIPRYSEQQVRKANAEVSVIGIETVRFAPKQGGKAVFCRVVLASSELKFCTNTSNSAVQILEATKPGGISRLDAKHSLLQRFQRWAVCAAQSTDRSFERRNSGAGCFGCGFWRDSHWWRPQDWVVLGHAFPLCWRLRRQWAKLTACVLNGRWSWPTQHFVQPVGTSVTDPPLRPMKRFTEMQKKRYANTKLVTLELEP